MGVLRGSMAALFVGIEVRDWRRWLRGKVRVSPQTAADLDVLEKLVPSEGHREMSDWLSVALEKGVVVSREEGLRLMSEVRS